MSNPLPPALAAGLLALAPLSACEATDAGALGTILNRTAGAGGAPADAAALSQADIEAGLREALTVGTRRVANDLGRTDGFLGDPRIRIVLPGRLGEMQRVVAGTPLAQPFDDLEVRLNRAAERAVPDARDLIVEAVARITLRDALDILNGPSDAATRYLQRETENALRSAFAPAMNAALDASGAFVSLETVAARNGLGGLTDRLRQDLVDTAVSEGLDGMFLYLAEEEARIRANPAARTSELLRRVFGERG